MKIKVVTTTEKDIELPAYHKSGLSFIKTVSETEQIIVGVYGFSTRIEINNYTVLSLENNFVESNADEFNEAYHKALDTLIDNQPIESQLEKDIDALQYLNDKL